jgi:hypothetical protein
MNRLSQERGIKKILARIYPTPDPLRSEEEGLRSRHQDLDNMTKTALKREYDRVQWCLLFDDNPDYWLVQREERLSRLIQTEKHDE